MGRRAAARRDHGGGESIPPFRALYVRLAVALAALALATGLAAYPLTRAGELAPLVRSLAALGLLSLIGWALRWDALAAPTLFALASEYAAVEISGRAGTVSLVVYSAGLVCLCELVFWFGDLAATTSVDGDVVVGRLALLAAIALAATVLALVSSVAGGLRLPGAFVSALVGTVAAVALLALPRLLVRRDNFG